MPLTAVWRNGLFSILLAQMMQPEIIVSLKHNLKNTPLRQATKRNPIKNYLCLSKESFVLSFFIINKEYKIWTENNQEILNEIRIKFELLDKNKIINHKLLTDLKLLDLIFWSKANRKSPIR